MFDNTKVKLGIAPIGWCNDDMPDLGAENTFKQTVSEMRLAGFTGCEIGNKYPKDPAELKAALDLRGMRIASRWYSSFLLTRPFEEEEKDFLANLDFLAAVGADRINVSEQSYSIQGQIDTPVLTGGHKYVMNDAEWDLFCDGLNKLGKLAADRGFKLCFHHHMGTVVQTSEETDRMMANTDPRYVFLCYDTGHFTFAGEDPLTMLKKYVDRVGHVHLKDMRLSVVEKVRAENWSFLDAVRNGAFTVPGDGNVNFDPVFEVLSKANYEGWLLVEAEQDPAKANAGATYDNDAIAACIVGGASFTGGKGTIWGTLIGALLMAVIRNGLNLMGASNDIQYIVIGAVIILAVTLDVFRNKMEAKARKMAAK